jgi:hypothetical protein
MSKPSKVTYEEAELIAIGRLAGRLHFEITGQQLGLFELPCHEALVQAMQAVGETDQAVNDLLNE